MKIRRRRTRRTRRKGGGEQNSTPFDIYMRIIVEGRKKERGGGNFAGFLLSLLHKKRSGDENNSIRGKPRGEGVFQ